MLFKMSSVCVVDAFPPFPAAFLPLLADRATMMGVLYFTRDADMAVIYRTSNRDSETGFERKGVSEDGRASRV